MQKIKLNNAVWDADYTKPLAPAGGFGEVFYGVGSDGAEVAIKKLKILAHDAAHREMSVGEFFIGKNFNHIVPVLDVGLDADSNGYFLVMPICSINLQQQIDQNEQLSPEQALHVVIAILKGLKEAGALIHRDIKPSNILLHDGAWKISDFGIAKFVEKSTSLRTLKESLTPDYAAPEQWELKAASVATDIYALGCISYTLATGTPPFADADDLRHAHLNEAPPNLDFYPSSAQSLINLMLRKSPDIRPSLDRCISVFEDALKPVETKSNTALTGALAIISADKLKQEAQARLYQEKRSERNALFDEAIKDIILIKNELFDTIKRDAEELIEKNTASELGLGAAMLKFDTVSNFKGGVIQNCDIDGDGFGVWVGRTKVSGWDFVALGRISISYRQKRGGDFTEVRSASLVFCRPKGEYDYRWLEMSFFSPFNKANKREPFAVGHIWEIDSALIALHSFQPAHTPIYIDGENKEAFINYWIDLFSNAATGNMPVINSFPFQR